MRKRDADETRKRDVVRTLVWLSWNDILWKVTLADEETENAGVSVIDSTFLTALDEESASVLTVRDSVRGTVSASASCSAELLERRTMGTITGTGLVSAV